MTKKQFVNSKGETWEYEETEEMRKAVEKLHKTIENLKQKHLIMELVNETIDT